jgi:hypothetical protein
MTMKKTAWAMAAMACLWAGTAQASTLILYDMDASTGRRVAASPYADQEIERMERAGLVRGYEFGVSDSGDEVVAEVEVVSPPPILPSGGVRTLVGRVVWRVTTQMNDGIVYYRNDVRSEQGFSNGQGTLADYRRTDVQLQGRVQAGGQGGRPDVVEAYTTNRGDRVMVGFLRP